MTENCNFKGFCNHKKDDNTCSFIEACIHQSIPIRSTIKIPDDIQGAINVFGSYGVTIQVAVDEENHSKNRVFIRGNTRLNLPKEQPYIKGKCFQRQKTGTACEMKCDDCRIWDNEKK